MSRFVLVELASFDLDSLLRPAIAQAKELIEKLVHIRARHDECEHDRVAVWTVVVEWDERSGFVNIDVQPGFPFWASEQGEF